jgi:K+-transporting ATPase ATPase C chain
MLNAVRRSVIFLIAFGVLLGLIYPVSLALIGSGLFGSKVTGQIQSSGSPLIGQSFTGPTWFHGRLGSYNAMASGGTNYGPRSILLRKEVSAAYAFYHSHGVNPTSQLVTSSASGLDPSISVNSALVQIPMVSAARGIAPSTLRRLILSQQSGRDFGFLGENTVNVLRLNQSLLKLAK